jgi:hypothetical protein
MSGFLTEEVAKSASIGHAEVADRSGLKAQRFRLAYGNNGMD